MKRLAALIVVLALAGYGIHALAQLRADVRPPATPMGTSSSNGMSFAWFYDATDRSVYVCRIGEGRADSLDCKAKATLP